MGLPTDMSAGIGWDDAGSTVMRGTPSLDWSASGSGDSLRLVDGLLGWTYADILVDSDLTDEALVDGVARKPRGPGGIST